MSREAKEKTIDGQSWEVQPWAAMYGLKMKAKLAKTLGPALAKAGAIDNLFDSNVEDIVSGLLSQLDENETPKLIRELLSGAFVDGKDMSNDRLFNDAFSANYLPLYKGLMFILEVNFGNFSKLAANIGSPLIQQLRHENAKVQPKAQASLKKKSKTPGRRGGSSSKK